MNLLYPSVTMQAVIGQCSWLYMLLLLFKAVFVTLNFVLKQSNQVTTISFIDSLFFRLSEEI